MTLSIITVNRNNRAGLARTLRSTFASQPGFDDWEQIVVDGASTDGSFDAIAPYKADPHLGWHVSEPDSGIYNAMNKGAAHARGDYLLFLNSGDELLPGALSKVFGEPRQADILYGGLVQCSPAGKESRWELPAPSEINPAWFLFRTLPHPASFISHAAFMDVGGYDESFAIVSDAKLFLEIVRRPGRSLQRLPMPVSKFYTGGISTNPAFNDLFAKEREQMLVPVFGQDTARCAAHPPLEKGWIREGDAMAAERDSRLARTIRLSTTVIVKAWKWTPLPFLARMASLSVRTWRRVFGRKPTRDN